MTSSFSKFSSHWLTRILRGPLIFYITFFIATTTLFGTPLYIWSTVFNIMSNKLRAKTIFYDSFLFVPFWEAHVVERKCTSMITKTCNNNDPVEYRKGPSSHEPFSITFSNHLWSPMYLSISPFEELKKKKCIRLVLTVDILWTTTCKNQLHFLQPIKGVHNAALSI